LPLIAKRLQIEMIEDFGFAMVRRCSRPLVSMAFP